MLEVPLDKRPLAPGAVLDYAGMQATVIKDYGYGSIDVRCEGAPARWHWMFDGLTCSIVNCPPLIQ